MLSYSNCRRLCPPNPGPPSLTHSLGERGAWVPALVLTCSRGSVGVPSFARAVSLPHCTSGSPLGGFGVATAQNWPEPGRIVGRALYGTRPRGQRAGLRLGCCAAAGRGLWTSVAVLPPSAASCPCGQPEMRAAQSVVLFHAFASSVPGGVLCVARL